jgi:hypothetical protein
MGVKCLEGGSMSPWGKYLPSINLPRTFFRQLKRDELGIADTAVEAT